jgi:hypothetical protein
MTRNPDYVLSLLKKRNAQRATRQPQSSLDELLDVLVELD